MAIFQNKNLLKSSAQNELMSLKRKPFNEYNFKEPFTGKLLLYKQKIISNRASTVSNV